MGNDDDEKRAQAARLRFARHAKGLEDATAGAAFLGISKHTYIQHESGLRSLKRNAKQYAARFDVTPEWLLWGRNAPAPSAPNRGIMTIPVISWTAAGKMRDPTTQIEMSEWPTIAVDGLELGDYFATGVGSDSMDRVSPEGSIIVVNRSDTNLIPGRAYIFSHRGETTFKRWQDDPPRLQPYSTNPENEAIFPKSDDEWDVIGRVRRTIFDL